MAKSPATPASETGPAPAPGAAAPQYTPAPMGAPTAPPMPATGPGTMPAAGDPNAMGAPTAPPMTGAMPGSHDPAAMVAAAPPPAMEMFTEKPFDMAAELSKSAEVESFQAATPVASAAPAASPPVEVEAHEPAPAAPGESAGYVAPPTLAPEPPVG